MTKSDIKKEIWKRARQEMKDAIIEQAKKRSLISYSELLNKVTSLQLDIELVDQRNIMAEMLGEISLAEDKAGRGMLSALVTHKSGDMVRIVFTDDGPGIAPENLKHVFDPFYTTKGVGKGTGLGLSICHGIVSAHGGRIYAESTVAKGASFTVELPFQ